MSRRIRAMLDSGDFNVARPSMALQELTQMMAGVRTLAFRVTPDLGDALTQLASRLGQSVGAVIRESVTHYLDASERASAAHQLPVTADEPAGSGATMRSLSPVQVSGSTNEDLPKVIVEPQAVQVIAGPGALRAAGVEADQRQAPEGADPNEQRWFKQ